MPQSILLSSGSIFNGNPITFAIKPNVVENPSFHRVIAEVECGMTEGNFDKIQESTPVFAEQGKEVTIDISSALRTFRDDYVYSPEPVTYPIVKFRVKAYDEYMINGEVHQSSPIFYPNETTYLCTIFGGFSDMERFTSSPSKGVIRMSRKPSTMPQLVAVGETLAYTPAYTVERTLITSKSLVAPQSKVATVTKEGAHTLGYQSVFGLPAAEAANRQVFRFINSYGVLESVSVPRVYSKKMTVTTDNFVISRQETFNSFSRATVRKHNNVEEWMFSTDPLDEAWLHWYLHEFLMAEFVWMAVPRDNQAGLVWLPVTITPDSDITFIDRTKTSAYKVAFSAVLDINGSPIF